MTGKSLSHYRIVDKLGAGGMGEVYRAEDTNLNRQIAIKVLPDIFAGDAERLARFEREAKPLATPEIPILSLLRFAVKSTPRSMRGCVARTSQNGWPIRRTGVRHGRVGTD